MVQVSHQMPVGRTHVNVFLMGVGKGQRKSQNLLNFNGLCKIFGKIGVAHPQHCYLPIWGKAGATGKARGLNFVNVPLEDGPERRQIEAREALGEKGEVRLEAPESGLLL